MILKGRTSDFAIFGGPPVLAEELPVGQLYFPSWTQYATAFEGVFQREYYTNHGPLLRSLEERLEAYLGVRNVVCVTNATIGLMIAATALDLRGRVIVPAFTFVATGQALTWCGLDPLFCDVDPDTHHLTSGTVRAALDRERNGAPVGAILGVNLWGGTCAPGEIAAVAEDLGLVPWFDSAQAFGCSFGGRKVGAFGRLEVFSFHATKVFSSAEGGCLATDDDDLADRARNIRSSYGTRRSTPVPVTTNGRFSEAQAAIAHLSLDHHEEHVVRNRALFARYRSGLAGVEGVMVVDPPNVETSNYQSVVCRVDAEKFGMSRDLLWRVLRAENVIARRYFKPGLHHSPPYGEQEEVPHLPVTDELCEVLIQLPVGERVCLDDVDVICATVAAAQGHASRIARWLGA